MARGRRPWLGEFLVPPAVFSPVDSMVLPRLAGKDRFPIEDVPVVRGSALLDMGF